MIAALAFVLGLVVIFGTTYVVKGLIRNAYAQGIQDASLDVREKQSDAWSDGVMQTISWTQDGSRPQERPKNPYQGTARL